ncbi:MAG: YkgJ family cysteine cluster protein [Chlamydiota bacterium]|jgi:Fe-S-cluster containining protein
MSSLKVLKPWYEKGLKFKCTECGKCCTGKDGYVFLSTDDIKNLSQHFKISVQEFLEKFTRVEYGKIALKDLNRKGDCIFLNKKKCMVYNNRPLQCRTFPWWPRILDSKEEWESTQEYCEGIEHENAETVPFDTIQENIEKMLQSDA